MDKGAPSKESLERAWKFLDEWLESNEAVRQASEAAAQKIVTELGMRCEGVEFPDADDIGLAEEIIERRLAPVLEAVLEAAQVGMRDKAAENLAEALETCLSLLENIRKDGYAGDYLPMLDIVLDGDGKDESLERTALVNFGIFQKRRKR